MRWLISLLLVCTAFALANAGEAKANPVLPFNVTVGGQKADGSNPDVIPFIAKPVKSDDDVVVNLPKVERLLVNIFKVKADDWPEDDPAVTISSTGVNRFRLNDAKDKAPLGDGYYQMQLLANNDVALIRFRIGAAKSPGKQVTDTAEAKKPEGGEKPDEATREPAAAAVKSDTPTETAQAQPKEPAVSTPEPEQPAQPRDRSAGVEPDDVFLLNVDGMVWKNGKRSAVLSSPVKIQAKGLAGSPKLTALLLLDGNGSVYDQKDMSGYSTPIRPIEACSICIVGMEPYILEGSKGEIWRYYREGPGKGKVDREPGSSRFMHGPCVDVAVSGPAEDRAKRTVYILGADSRVYVGGRPKDGLSPAVGLNKPQAIAVDGDDVYVLDGANGKVYRNGQHAPELSSIVFIPCVDLAVRNGKSYILTPDGGVLINGKKDPAVSSDVTSQFVGLYVGRLKAK